MTRRDILWRAAGAVLMVAACGAAVAMEGSALVIIALPVALIGLTLIVNGKHVATAFRAERRGHYRTAEVIHAERVRRHRRCQDQPRF